MAKIVLENIVKRWDHYYGVDNLNLEIKQNTITALLGSAGCGKSTTMRMIAGLEKPTSGKIMIDNQVVFDHDLEIDVSAKNRKIGVLLKDLKLKEKATAYQNIGATLRSIKKVMPLYAEDVRTLKDLVSMLEQIDVTLDVILGPIVKNRKLNYDRAIVRLIDKFEISRFTAEKFMAFKLHISSEAISQLLRIYQNKLAKAIEHYQSRGFELADDFSIWKDGVPVDKKRRLTSEEVDLKIRKVARKLKLNYYLDTIVSDLTPIQKQLVALARTVAPDPEIVLMDESLSTLQPKARLEMRLILQRFQLQTGKTMLYVTDDQHEALSIASNVFVMDKGILQQSGSVKAIYKTPANTFVADFVGNPGMNFVRAHGKQERDGSFAIKIFDEFDVVFEPNKGIGLFSFLQKETELASQVKEYSVERLNKYRKHEPEIEALNSKLITHKQTLVVGEDFLIGIRPQLISLSKTKDSTIPGLIYNVMPAGIATTLRINLGNYFLTAVVPGDEDFCIEAQTNVSFKENEIMLFDAHSGKLLGVGSLRLPSDKKEVASK